MNYSLSRRELFAVAIAFFLPRILNAECPITEENVEGPFYREGAPLRSNLHIENEPGEVLVVSGKLTGNPGCAPLKEALLDIWQADASGKYDNDSPKFLHRGKIKTRPDGSYQFQTVKPAPYPLDGFTRPAHIHFKISSPGYDSLTTQLYFEGDPHLSKDPFVKKSLIKQLQKENSALRCVFDIALEKA